MVFLHGNPADLSVWEGQVDWFARRHCVIRYDLRGYGKSQAADVPYSHAEDLACLLDYLGVDGAHIVGWSMGGSIVADFELVHPGRARSLVLVDSSLGGYPYSEAFLSSFAPFNDNRVCELGLERVRDDLFSHPLLAQAMKIPEAVRLFKASFATYSGWHWTHLDPAIHPQPPVLERLEAIAAPTLVLCGEQDMPDFLGIAQLLGTRIPGARTITFPGTGHCPPLEIPDSFNGAVEAFIDDVERIP